MVASITAVSQVSRPRREERHAPRHDSGKKDGEKLFARILEESMEEKKREQQDCYTTTYDRNRTLQAFSYRTREYRY